VTFKAFQKGEWVVSWSCFLAILMLEKARQEAVMAFNAVRRHFAEAYSEDWLRFLQPARFREH